MVARRSRAGSEAFTVEFPTRLPVRREGEHWWVTLDDREVRLSNLTKVFWSSSGYTKGDLIAYYHSIAPWILPYLEGRPLTLKRMPNGADGQFFYEKEYPPNTPSWMPLCQVPSEERAAINYLMADHAACLLFVANLGCIEFHPLHSRCGDIHVPDYLFFDLDPFEPASFEDVLIVAAHVRAALDALGLRGYPKISGATGVQIYVPIEPRYTYDAIRALVGRVGHTIRRADPGRVTMEWEVRKRTGKVFIDHNMNREGANIAAVYSVRPEPGATVSTPLTWEEVEARQVRPADFDIKTIWRRLDEVGDLFGEVLTRPQSLDRALDVMGVRPDTVAPLPANIQGARGTKRPSDVPRGGRSLAGDAAGGNRGTRVWPKSSDVIARSRDPKLEEYLRKRDLSETPEPGPAGRTSRGDSSQSLDSLHSFVIQKHRATRLHYDTRLERDGVLVSWAVPKGLPVRKGEKRLAVQTEDHPLEYGSFEGVIPEGHYGAGPVRIFDSGTYDTLEWTDRKITFRLHGTRYDGAEFHLVKTSTDWLVFLARPDEVPVGIRPPTYSPMLAEGGHEAFDDPGWRFEPKLDGVRTLLYVDMESTRLVSRSGRDQTSQYPELSTAHEYITSATAVLDGEIVAMRDGRPSFELLQQRINLSSKTDIERARKATPVECYAFDLLYLDGRDLTDLPLERRRELLEELMVPGHRMLTTLYVDGEGVPLAAAARDRGFEGVVAKRLGSRYLPGKRTSDWRKIKLLNRQECVVLGWTPGNRSRSSTFGALLIGAHDDGELKWIGQVGTGFTDGMLADLMQRLAPLLRDEPAVADPELRKLKGARFVEPRVVCEVEFLEMTGGGKLRAPSYKGLRTDKEPEDCVLERPQKGSKPARARSARASRSSIPRSSRSR